MLLNTPSHSVIRHWHCISNYKPRKYLSQTFSNSPREMQNSSSTAPRMLSISSAAWSMLVTSRGGGGSTCHVHRSPASYTLLSPQRPAARLCETNSLFSTRGAGSMLRGGALYGISKTMAPYGEQKDPPLAYSMRGKHQSTYA